MKFVDVTRHGGMRILRLASTAVAYLDECEGGTSVHLVGGETLRVNEDPDEIERRLGSEPPVRKKPKATAPTSGIAGKAGKRA